ncbi:MAG TPA: efflux RND transporter periplasmic adaptor subunit [Bacteroidota bacterium]|nr:efflux RND transporter periplasmic adaptor subunit [Bacteroidota bacterium]
MHPKNKQMFTAGAISALLVAAAVLSGCGKGGRAGMAFPPMPVEVSPVIVQKVSDKFEGIGTIEALEAITVVSEIDGAIKDLPFQEGGFIHRGDLIAQIDDTQLAAELARADALRGQSKATYDRVKSVVDQGAGAPQDLDDASAALKVAEANYELARARWLKSRIVAPFDGIIGARKLSVGTFIRGGQPITELANIDEIRVTFSAPERYVSRLARGADVTISTTAFQGFELTGKIIVIEPVIDPLTRSARVVAHVQNSGRKFRPGMSANVTAILGERPDALTIPSEAVFGSGSQSFVFIVKPDSTVARVPLTLGTRMADVVEVVDGLNRGMTVVRAGHQKLFDGGKVMPIPAAEQKPDSAAKGSAKQ